MQTIQAHVTEVDTEQQRLFFRCLHTDWSSATISALTQLAPAQWQTLVLLAEQQQVAALLYYRWKRYQQEVPLPTQIKAMLYARFYYSAGRNQLLWQEISAIADLFHQHQIALLVLKGAALLATVYPDKALRQMADIDLLVAEETIGKAVELLQRRGYQAKSQLGETITDHFTILHHLPPFIHPGSKICIELHLTVAPPQRTYSVDSADLWAAAQPLPAVGPSALTLAAEDLLLYTCMHATYRHLFELGARFLCDVDAIVRHYQASLDWERIVARAQEWQWGNGVFLGLHLAHRLLETPIPSSTLRALQPEDFQKDGVREQILDDSLSLIFDHESDAAAVDGEFAQKWETLSWRTKIAKGVRMILLSRRKMATHYPSPPDSLKIFLYYPVRVKDLLVNNLPRIQLMWRKEPTIAHAIQRKSRLLHWLQKR